jgi:Protein of unknown function (DUF4232)
MKPRLALNLAAAISVVLALAGAAVAVLPTAGSAADVPQCTAAHLYVARGRVDAGAGQRYLPIRVTNVGDTLCVVPRATRVRFRDFEGPLGGVGASPAVASLLPLQPGASVSTVVHWTDPGPVPQGQCQAAEVTLVTLRLPDLGHTWRLPLVASVCTTAAYRPDVTPLRR